MHNRDNSLSKLQSLKNIDENANKWVHSFVKQALYLYDLIIDKQYRYELEKPVPIFCRTITTENDKIYIIGGEIESQA